MNCIETIKLPAPTFDDTMKVSDAIAKRRSIRAYDGHALDEQTLANLCYFSAGITDEKHAFTANPTACNSQEILLYVVTGTEVSLYDPKEHVLHVIEKGDFRAEMAMQPFAKTASVQFVYVRKAARFSGLLKDHVEAQDKYEKIDTGIMAQNTCLYATAIGLGSVMRGMFEEPVVSSRLQLPEDEHAILTVSVG